MDAKIVPMGNSLGVRIPKTFLESLGINSKDASVTMEIREDAIVIKKQADKKMSFEARMEAFYQKPFAEIDVRIEGGELSSGGPVGGEVW